ncbi:hypothetical protein PIROE2DRAFT_8056 [Piromyces sp. E2]|nr:hypothetical protein PIROE2DRAFT_8056 [Piromyces sp. E2]|eukprot:OUM64993.1 hypothetical protein PIROE2DRAFT_8056 [Piromyces sp. E2]
MSLIKILVKHGLDINLKDEQGYTLLLKAYLFKRFDLAYVLLCYNADIEQLNKNIEVLKLLMFEKYYEPCSAIRDLIRLGLDVNATDDYGMNLLIYAIMTRNIKIIELLLKYGADPLYVNEYENINRSIDDYNEIYNTQYIKEFKIIQNILELYKLVD